MESPAGKELCHGHSETEFQHLGKRGRGQPGHHVGHHRRRRRQEQQRQLHQASPALHLPFPN